MKPQAPHGAGLELLAIARVEPAILARCQPLNAQCPFDTAGTVGGQFSPANPLRAIRISPEEGGLETLGDCPALDGYGWVGEAWPRSSGREVRVDPNQGRLALRRRNMAG